MNSLFYSIYRRDFIELEVVEKLKIDLPNNKSHYIVRGLDEDQNKKLSSFITKEKWELFDVPVKLF